MKGFFNISFATASQARREPIYYILTGIFALLVYSSQYLVLFVFEGEDAAVMETGIASITACGFLLALLLSWLLIRKEMEQMSILTVLSKPVSRFSFVSGKYTGLLYAIFLSTVFLFLMFCLNLWHFRGPRMLDRLEQKLSTSYMNRVEVNEEQNQQGNDPSDTSTDERSETSMDVSRLPSGFMVGLIGAYKGLKLFVFKMLLPGLIGTIPAFLSIALVLAICTVSSIFFEMLPTIGFTIGFLILGSLSGSLYHVLAVTGDPGFFSWMSGWFIHLLIPDLFRLNIASHVGSNLTMETTELIWHYLSFLAYAVISSVFFVCFVLTAGTALFQRKEIT